MRVIQIATIMLLVSALSSTLGAQKSNAKTSLPAYSASGYVIIINPGNRSRTLDRKFVANVFLKKTKYWPNGTAIHPVDLKFNSSMREKFTEDILKRSINAVKTYWQQRIFSGRDLPPPELDSHSAVVSYVLKHAGGIGYVSAATPLGNAAVVTVR